MYKGHSVSVVMPAYNEKENIARIVADFKALNIADEIIVVDNNSNDSTGQLAKDAGARVIAETRQGYGYACQQALKQAAGSYVVLVEPDGTFVARDVYKFFSYIEDFELVQGTRTTKELIWDGANMGHMLKWGNGIVAKILQVIYKGPSLSDMGCTYRMIRRQALDRIKDNLTVGGSAFLAEMTVEALKSGVKVIEIPVHYLPRKGLSKITGNKLLAVTVGLHMLFILATRLFKRRNAKE